MAGSAQLHVLFVTLNCISSVPKVCWTCRGTHHCMRLTRVGRMHAQIRGVVRFTVDPMVDVIPCLGALSISLLEAPHLSVNLSIINNLDLLSLPFIRIAVRTQLRVPSAAPA